MSTTLIGPGPACLPRSRPPSSHAAPPTAAPREARLRDLADRIRAIEGEGRPAGPVRSTGLAGLDAWLPGGGLRAGSLTDVLLARRSSGGVLLTFAWASQLLGTDGVCAVVDGEGTFHAAPLVGWGWPLGRTLVFRPKTPADLIWATEQALACPSVRVVVVRCGAIGDRAFRRWQLAAESGGAVGLLVRPDRHLHEPAWADLRLRVTAEPIPADGVDPCWSVRRHRLETVYARNATRPDPLTLDLDDETGALSVATPLAGAAGEARRGESSLATAGRRSRLAS